MSYKVNFKAVGFTAPSADNPKGIRVAGSGHLIVDGERPESNLWIPFRVVAKCRDVFLQQCQCVRLKGDSKGLTNYPTVWLANSQ